MRNSNKILLISIILISIFGIIMIYSASHIWANYKYNDSLKYVKNQTLFFIVGLFLLYFFSKLNYKWYYNNSNKILFVCYILLILVLIPGIGSIRNGSRSWFGIGPFGIIKNVKKGVLPVLALTFIIFFTIMLQPDFGTGTILVMSIIGLLFVGGVSVKFFLKIGLVGLMGVVGLILIAPYRLSRILSFIDPWKDPLGSGFQIIQSMYAIGPGGLFGMGFGNSIQKHFYLPEPQTDFIFSIISEEFGVMGAIIVVGLFSILLYRGIKISLNTKDSFSKYLSFGILFQIIFQAIMNLSVVVGLIPVTGVTLPFLSYGGSSLLVSMGSIGIILNISKPN